MAEEQTPESKTTPVEDKLVTTEHSIKLGKKELKYFVTAGTMVLKAEDMKEGEKPRASIFYIAYQLKTDQPKGSRPVTFSFNGGPGSSSVWMHLGLLGPKRVRMDDEGMPYPPPYSLIPNEFSPLETTDLVFIDPVSTGYSRAVPGQNPGEFHGLKADMEAVGDFIAKWTTRNQRWTSPKFIIGESYGTTRASGLSKYLQERHGYYLNGVMLISAVLNFLTLRFDSGNDLPYPLILPSYTATAWYHKALPKDLQAQSLDAVLKQAKEFAGSEYMLGLMKGSSQTKAERAALIKKLARFTGLSETYLDLHDLRVNTVQFCKELRRKEGLAVGRLDSRFAGPDDKPSAEDIARDPSHISVNGPYTATIYDYVRGELEFEFDIPYEIIKRLEKWTYDEGKYTDVSPDLRVGFMVNPNLRVYIANGYFDLATPYFATEYTVDHLGLPANLAERIQLSYFEAGHMMYLHLPSLKKLGKELTAFIKSCLP